MLRGCILFLVIALLLLQFLASLGLTGLYAAEKVYLDHRDLAYDQNWLYYFKWVVKPLSAAIALLMVLPTICSCICGSLKGKVTGGMVYPSFLGFVSLAFSVLWGIIVGELARHSWRTTVHGMIKTTAFGHHAVYPLGQGFSLQNDCHQPPFTILMHGVRVCKLLKAESIVSIVAFAIWLLTLLASFGLCFIVRSNKRPSSAVKA